MKTQKCIYLLIMFFLFSCNNSQKQERLCNPSLSYADSFKNNIQQIEIFNKEHKIIYDEIIDSICDYEEQQNRIIPITQIILKVKKTDSISIARNNEIFFNERTDNIYRIILVYDDNLKSKTFGVKGFLNMDTTSSINIFEIRFIKQNLFLQFRLLKRTRLITIYEEKNKWKIVYSNCTKQFDE